MEKALRTGWGGLSSVGHHTVSELSPQAPTVSIQPNRRPAFWLELTSFVLTIHVGVSTCILGDAVHRQQSRLGREGLVGFRQNI